MKKLLYIGHAYHIKTGSTVFLTDILKKEYEISYVLFDPYTKSYKGIEEAQRNRYDVLVLFQMTIKFNFLFEKFVFDQGIFFPMYDHMIAHKDVWKVWKEYRTFKIICFSLTLHNQLKQKGYKSYYIQYFPKPIEDVKLGNLDSAFFWQRLEIININTVLKLLKEIKLNHIHIHKALDPEQNFIEPENLENIKISYSEWFKNISELYNIMQRSAIYVAPRLYEGIGMGFLEAMAMGRCVIAPDTPTMNEYIKDGINGILYNPNQINPIKIDNIRQIQKNAKEYIEKGYNNWEKNQDNILKWIVEDIEQPLVTVVTVERNCMKSGKKEQLQKCIESVHNQLYANIQHLIIDGNSEDGSINMLNQYQKLGWLEFISVTDSEKYKLMNIGIENSKGKYIVFLNADSYFNKSNAVWESVFSLENSQSDYCFASDCISDKEEKILIRKPQIVNFIVQMPFCFQTMFAKKEMLINIGMFNEKYKSAGDYELILKAILAGYKQIEIEEDIVGHYKAGIFDSTQQYLSESEEKKEIYKNLYSQIYDKILNDKIVQLLVEDKCPKDLFDNIMLNISENLKKEFKAAINNDKITYDKSNQLCILPESIVFDEFTENSETSSYNNILENYEKRLNKFVNYFELLNKWLWLKLQNKSIGIYFKNQNYHNVAIYGMGKIGKRLYEELSQISNISVKYAIDKNKKISNVLPILSLEEELPDVDIIIVTNNYIYSQIYELLKKKTNSPIVSIDDVIFGIK